MDEKETIIRVEQQLQDAVKNQTQIIEDLRTVFNRIDRESKIISAIRSDLKSHLDSSVVRKEELNNRFKYAEERFTELKESYNKFRDKVSVELDKSKVEDNVDFSIIKKEIKDVSDKVEVTIKNNAVFETEIRTSMKITKWVFGGVISLGTLIVAIIKIIEFISTYNIKIGH